jgi:prolyl oligopeptidase
VPWIVSLWIFLSLLTANAERPELAAPPPAKNEPVTDTYHGVKIQDDYRWLENLRNPETFAWADAQNIRARHYLESLPIYPKIRADVEAQIRAPSTRLVEVKIADGVIFGLKKDSQKQQAELVAVRSSAKPEAQQVICDPNLVDPSGGTAIDWYAPSSDGKYVALSLSKNGSELGDLHLFDAATGKEFDKVIPGVQCPTGGGSAAWTSDDSGVYYTRYPRAGERPAVDRFFYQQVYFHRLGQDPDRDEYSLGRELPKIAEIALQTAPSGGWILATVANGDGGQYEHFVLGPDHKWQQITRFDDAVRGAVLGPQNNLFAVFRGNSLLGEVVRYDLGTADPIKRATVVPPGQGSVDSLAVSSNSLFVKAIDGGPSGLTIYDFSGRTKRTVPLPPISAVKEVAADGDLALVRVASYTAYGHWFQCSLAPSQSDGSGAQLTDLALDRPPSLDLSNLTARRETATSRDGTKIPFTVIYRRDLDLKAGNPTILYGYGGYGINDEPSPRLTYLAWLKRGGLIVDTNLRGGAEFGEAWHRGGMLANKQNVFDDFFACGQRLTELGYTSSPRLGLLGGSNGGLLMGAMITQHPTLAKVVVSEVGVYDLVRSELEPNGEFNVTEYGSVKDPALFRAIYAYSPYHHVVDGQKYPAILLTTGLNDGRVAPHNSFKFAARLQSAAAPGNPVLLTVSHFGHGIGSSTEQRIQDETDMLAFFASELGVANSATEKTGSQPAEQK